MPHTLTRRNISAIAKLDLSSLGHAQRIDAIAGALGYPTGAALMATLKAAEVPTPAPRPIRAVVAFGSTVISNITEGEPLRDKYGNVEGLVSEMTFATAGEIAAYARGLADADGWEGCGIIADDIDTPEHPFLMASRDDPKLDFVDWHDAQLGRGAEENARADMDGSEKASDDYEDTVVTDWVDVRVKAARYAARKHDREKNEKLHGRRDQKVLGYQVDCYATGENWGDRPSYAILPLEMALSDLREAILANRSDFRLLIIREGDIEEPTFE